MMNTACRYCSTPCFRDDKVVAGRLEARRAGRSKLAPEDLVEAAVRGLAQACPGVAVGHHLHIADATRLHALQDTDFPKRASSS